MNKTTQVHLWPELGQRHLKRVGDGAIRDLAGMHVDRVSEANIGGTGFLKFEIRDPQHVRKSDIAQRIRTGAADGAGHVGHAVMHDAVHEIGRF